MCGKSWINWCLVYFKNVHSLATCLFSLCQAIHEAIRLGLFGWFSCLVAGYRDRFEKYFEYPVFGLISLVYISQFLLIISMCLIIASTLLSFGILPDDPYMSVYIFVEPRSCNFLLGILVNHNFFFLKSWFSIKLF